MFILAAEATLARLRRESPSRALRDPAEVVALPLDCWKQDRESGISESLAEEFEIAAARDRRPAVAICEVTREGDVVGFVRDLDRLAAALASRLQRDRMPFPLQAVVLVGENRIGPLDLECLRLLCGPGASKGVATSANRSEQDSGATDYPSLAELLPPRLPVYLMLGRTRLDSESRSWPCSEIWPIAVTRLLASIDSNPTRTGGLRAWRAFASSLGGDDSVGLEREVLAIIRDSVAGVSGEQPNSDAARAVKVLREEVVPEDPPTDSVSTSASPRHRLDRFGQSKQPHPPVPEFWELDPAIPESSDPTGAAARHTRERLDSSPESQWQARRFERGSVFIRDRGLRLFESVFTFAGPRSILRRVWQRIHRHAGHLPWHAEGGFIRLGDRRELSIVADQARAWQAVESLDREATMARTTAEEMATELDRTRSRFAGIPWRIGAVFSSALFAAAIVGTVTAAFPPQWIIYVGVGTAATAALTGLAIVVSELVAARRGRNLLEFANANAEAALSRSFHARLELGSDGELLQRSMAWLQSAARVRETARRLLELQSAALERTLVTKYSPNGGTSGLGGFAAATTVDTDIGIAREGLAAALRRVDPSFGLELDASFQRWWVDALRAYDAGEVGSIHAGQFRPQLESELRGLRDKARARLLRLIEERESKPWLDDLAGKFARTIGQGTDFATLSVQTERARGRQLRRGTFVIGGSDDLRERMAQLMEASTLEGFSASRTAVEIEAWGAAAIAVDEISVEVEPNAAGTGLVFHEGLAP